MIIEWWELFVDWNIFYFLVEGFWLFLDGGNYLYFFINDKSWRYEILLVKIVILIWVKDGK